MLMCCTVVNIEKKNTKGRSDTQWRSKGWGDGGGTFRGRQNWGFT